jgi:hypothetical protein
MAFLPFLALSGGTRRLPFLASKLDRAARKVNHLIKSSV